MIEDLDFLKIYLFLALLSPPVTSYAQYGSIRGHVYDAQKIPTEDVYVELLTGGTNKVIQSMMTDSLGHYYFDPVAEGVYNVRASHNYLLRTYLAVNIPVKMGVQSTVDMHCESSIGFGNCPGPIYMEFDKRESDTLITISPSHDTNAVIGLFAVSGYIRNPENIPVKKATVSVYSGDSLIACVLSNEQGFYQFSVKAIKTLKLNYHARYKGKRKRKYFYPAVIIRNVDPFRGGHRIDVKLQKTEYIECSDDPKMIINY